MTAFRLQPDAAARKALIGLLLCAGYTLSLWGSLRLIGKDAVPPFWPSNAFLAAMVILLPRRLLLPCIGFAAVCATAFIMPRADAPTLGLVRVVFNMGEGLLAGVLACRVLGPRRLLRTAAGFLRLQLLAVLPAVVFDLIMRDTAMRLLAPESSLTAWRLAVLPHLLGLATVLPALLLVVQPTLPELKRSRTETAAILITVALVAYLSLNQERMPSAFIISPMLLLAALRLGPRGSMFGNLIVAVILLPVTISGQGPFALHPDWNLQDRATIYQAACLGSLFAMSMTAFMVAEQARLRRLLVRRAAAAREARRRALIASRAKSDFLATMSHEIRTPMNSILGFTQALMQDRTVPEAAHRKIEVIAQAGDSLMTVLNDILDFSKVEAGQIDLHVEPVDVAACVAHVAEIVQGPARARGLAVRLETDGVDGRYELDAQRLRQVLLNLLNNAVKFTEEGHVLLSAAYVEPAQVLRFEVRDSGIGIDPAVTTRLFTRFSQADSSTTRDYGGSGLGLAICKGLVERMGGRIGVESQVSFGSTFWFELPARRLDTAQGPVAAAAGPAALHGRILVVDDHAMNRQLGETLLSLLGCQVDLAASGEEAVQAASERSYDAILMDVHMPRMDGLAAARAIQSGGGPSARSPIIAMSADVMTRNLEQCRQAGMVDHIAKPIQLAVMHAVLERWLADHKRRSAA